MTTPARPLAVCVIDVGKPGKNLGWSLDGPDPAEGTDIEQGIAAVAAALEHGPVALGFEAPLFVPLRDDPAGLLRARSGESGPGLPSRPFTAGAGPTALVTALMLVPFVLQRLRRLVPTATAVTDWRRPLLRRGELLLFEAFVTDQRKTSDTRHVEDARLAIAAFRRVFSDPTASSAIAEPMTFSLLGAALLRTGWTEDLVVLAAPCLVVRA